MFLLQNVKGLSFYIPSAIFMADWVDVKSNPSYENMIPCDSIRPSKKILFLILYENIF
jgi:hypothetical protein